MAVSKRHRRALMKQRLKRGAKNTVLAPFRLNYYKILHIVLLAAAAAKLYGMDHLIRGFINEY